MGTWIQSRKTLGLKTKGIMTLYHHLLSDLSCSGRQMSPQCLKKLQPEQFGSINYNNPQILRDHRSAPVHQLEHFDRMTDTCLYQGEPALHGIMFLRWHKLHQEY